MNSQNDFMCSSLIEKDSIVSNPNEFQADHNITYNRQRAATFSSPSELIFTPTSFLTHKKRRSKHDQSGRNFLCEYCHKSYLSYPALYTHSKTKHILNPLPSRSMCGKSRKNSEMPFNSYKEYFEVSERKGITQDFYKSFLNSVQCFYKEMGWDLSNPEDHPMAKVMKELNKSETCDEAFAEYCKSISTLTNDSSFERVCSIVLGYRECLNEYGWGKLFEEKTKVAKPKLGEDNLPMLEVCLEYSVEQQKSMKQEYSSTNDPDRIPEVANEFVLLFSKKHNLGVTQSELIDIVMNMCDWLFENKYTKTQVAFIN